MTLKESAHKYAEQGIQVFACHGIHNGECTCSDEQENPNNRGKHPATPHGHKDATSDPVVIDGWWSTNPEYNIGLYCKPSGFFAMDVDPRNGGDESFEKLLELLDYALPETVEALTGVYMVNGKPKRGRHFYFKYTGDARLIGNFKKQGLPGIDIKHDGYVLAPPSAHHSGVNYEWKPGHAPWEMKMAEAPQSLLAELETSSSSHATTSPMAASDMKDFVAKANTSTAWGAAALLSELEALRNTPEGGRNNALFSTGCRIGQLIAGEQVDGEAALTQLILVASEIGLDEAEIQDTLFRPEGAISRGLQEPRVPTVVEIDADLLAFANRMNEKKKGSLLKDGSSAVNRARIIDWDSLFNAEEELEEWFVPGFICAKRNHSIYSDAGLGKSLLMREAAAGLASGREFFGFEAFPRRVKVLYLDYENNPHGDIKRSLIDMGYAPADLDEYLFMASFPDFLPLDTELGAAQLLEVVDEIQPELVIIDTVSRVISGKENENDTWIRFYNFLGEKLKQREIAVIRLDHEGKNADAGARGGSAKRGDVDLVWHYERKGAKFKMTCEKSRGMNATDWFEVSRFVTPHLYHSITKSSGATGFSWDELIERSQPYLHADEIIRKSIDANEGVLVGQSAMWRKLRDQFTDEGVSKRVFEDVHRSIKKELAGILDYTTEEMQEIFGDFPTEEIAPVAPQDPQG